MSRHFNDARIFHPVGRFIQYSMPFVSSKGAIIGDTAIVTQDTRSATIICLEDCIFATLSAAEYCDLVKKDELVKMSQKLEFFEKCLPPDTEKKIVKKVSSNFVD